MKKSTMIVKIVLIATPILLIFYAEARKRILEHRMEKIESLFGYEPAYIKHVAAYEEGDGLYIYFILADRKGRETRSSGEVKVTIVGVRNYSGNPDVIEREDTLWQRKLSVQRSDFRIVKTGTGAFKREALICPIGRVPYSSFKTSRKYLLGRVYVEFTIKNWITSEEKTFKGEKDVLFTRM